MCDPQSGWYNYRLYSICLEIQSPCQMMIRVANQLLSIVFRFHYHYQKVIGSLGYEITSLIFVYLYTS